MKTVDWLVFVSLGAMVCMAPAAAQVAGEVVQARGGETVLRGGTGPWQPVQVGDALAPGDAVRTGPYGLLALLLEDETQVRLHPNSRLTVDGVRKVAGDDVTRLQLPRGSLWARALPALFRRVTSAVARKPVQSAVEIDTVTATIGIRGTDWHIFSDPDDETVLTVLDGEAEMRNPHGAVTVGAGEVAVAKPGLPPVKRVLLKVQDRPLMSLDFTLRWFDWLLLTRGDTIAALTERWARLDSLPESELTPALLIARAEAAYDRRRFPEAAALLAAARDELAPDDRKLAARATLLEGLLLARDGRLDEAEPLLAAAQKALGGPTAAIAGLAHAGVAAQSRRYLEAARRLEAVSARHPDVPEVAVYEIIFAYFRGDEDLALELEAAAEARFPADPRFPAALAQLALVLDQPETMRDAFNRALALDPQQPFALHAKGMYYQAVEPDAEQAGAAYRAALAVTPYLPETWSNLALLYLDLGDFASARQAVSRALEVAPEAALAHAREGTLRSYTDRLQEAEVSFAQALALDPSHPEALLGQSLAALQQGRGDEAITMALRSSAANPSLPDGPVVLGAAYYQEGRRDAAVKTLETARRLDPNNPLPDIMLSVIAQDRAEAGKAIRAAREGLDKTLRYGTYAVETMANSRSGISNLGSAYSSLGLNAWGTYYAQLAFDPYQAAGPLFLSDKYPTLNAQLGSGGQGLLLDTLAVSAPNRYFQFVREPRDDLTVGADWSDTAGGGTARGVNGIAQGFLRAPEPVAYRAFFSDDDDQGFRDNTASRDRAFFFDLGTRFNERRDNLLLSAAVVEQELGIPGPVSAADPDDESSSKSVSIALGYHRRRDYDDRVLARVTAGHSRLRVTNPAPFGTGLTDVDLSLMSAFGEQRTRDLYTEGLYDFTRDLGFAPSDPFLVYGANGDALCGTPAFPQCQRRAETLPAWVDDDFLINADTRSRELGLQFRHLFRAGDLDLTYGAEWVPSWSTSKLEAAGFRVGGLGALTDLAGGDPELFNFLEPSDANRARQESRTLGASIYGQGRWTLTTDLQVDAGLFVRHYDDDARSRTTGDPRLGIGWRPAAGHWLRAAVQSELVLPVTSRGTLAPVATVGLVPSDTYTAGGSRVSDAQLRWDAEWSPHLYTFAAAGRTEVEDFVRFIDQSFDAISGDEGRIDTLAIGANLWFAERFGLFVQHRWRESENRGSGPDAGNELPLVPDATLDVGLTWVHPSQTRVSLGISRVGSRWADLGNSQRLDGYWTTSASVNWQPHHKHWSLSLAGSNLGDQAYERAAGYPAPGRSVSLAVEYRF